MEHKTFFKKTRVKLVTKQREGLPLVLKVKVKSSHQKKKTQKKTQNEILESINLRSNRQSNKREKKTNELSYELTKYSNTSKCSPLETTLFSNSFSNLSESDLVRVNFTMHF